MDGLTEGGKKLLADTLELGSYAKDCIRIIHDILAKKPSPHRWPQRNGVHVVDAAAGVTLNDYSLIKAHLMLIGKWPWTD